jgi:dienelactone hydrolase
MPRCGDGRRRRLEVRPALALAGLALASVAAPGCLGSAWAQGDPTLLAAGVVEPQAVPQDAQVPDRFQLAPQPFAWQARRMQTVTPTLEVWNVTFPSPVVTEVPANNTVHAEFYRSRRDGRRPAVIVLHILGGDFALSRLFCNCLAQHGVHALFVKMPYYGPRRDPASPRRMVAADPHQTVLGMTQAVLDIRRATAWLADRPEVDPAQLGIFGISLGGITAALALAVEPRLTSGCLLLAGGDIAQVGWEAAELKAVRANWEAQGGTRETFQAVLRQIDPVTYAGAARGKRMLMLNAAADEVIPRRCTLALWEALGQPKLVWYSGGHYSVIRHLPRALVQVAAFFRDPAPEH